MEPKRLNMLELFLIDAVHSAIEAYMKKPVRLEDMHIGDTNDPEWEPTVRIRCHGDGFAYIDADCDLVRQSSRHAWHVSTIRFTPSPSEKPKWKAIFRPDGLLEIVKREGGETSREFVKIERKIIRAPNPEALTGS